MRRIDPYVDFARTYNYAMVVFKYASWNTLYRLYNHHHETGRRPPLNFDPFVYPITYWNHCLVGHKDALRPDIRAWLNAEKSKGEATVSMQSHA